MTERFPSQQQENEPSEQGAGNLLEIVDDLRSVETQFVESLDELVESEIDDTKEALGEAADIQSLQEKHGTPYEPLKVITGIGRAGMELSSPELFVERAKRATVEAMEEGEVDEIADVVSLDEYRERKKEKEGMPQKTIYRENGLAYAQDQPETEKYAPEATRIIDALINGDDSLLGALPQDFAEALRVRMESYENGVSSEEREAMISVACNGLAEAHGEALAVEGSPEAKAQDEAWERDQEQQRAA